MQINDNSKPLIFLGTNENLYQLVELAESHGITVAGVIDSDYFGNRDTFCNQPVIDNEQAFDDVEKLNYYKSNFNFFCATNPIPTTDEISVRNYQKRQRLLGLIDTLELSCISLIGKNAVISPSAVIGKGVFLDNFTNIESKVVIQDYVSVYSFTTIAHFSVLGRNSQFHRNSFVGAYADIGENVHFGPMVRSPKTHLKFSAGTFIQTGITIMRSTLENEVVSVHSGNTRRVTFNNHLVE